MRQIKLDDTFDLAVEADHAWVIDYSGGLHNPKHGPHQCFNYGQTTDVIGLEARSPNEALIIHKPFGGQVVNLIAHIDGDSITFIDQDENEYLKSLKQIEQEYMENLTDIHAEFLRDTTELEKPENRDAVKLLELKKDLERHIADLALHRHHKIESLKSSPDT